MRPLALLLLCLACGACASGAARSAAKAASQDLASQPAADATESRDDDDDDDEVPVALDDLPAAVLSAIERDYPGARIAGAELDDGVYEVDILTASGACIEVDVAGDGTVLGADAEDAEDCT